MAAEVGGVDPWTVQPRERSRYEEQFRSLNPVNGILTGQQAKGFLVQSQLPVDVLGQIWALSDVDADGRLDINEFSIACKLINLKLRGFPIPSALPLSLKSLTLQSPVITSQHVVPNVPIVPPHPTPPMIPPQPLTQVGLPLAPVMPPQAVPIIPPQPVISQQSFIQPPFNGAQSVITTQPMMPVQPIAAANAISRPSLIGLSNIPSSMPQVLPAVSGITPPALPPMPALPILSGVPTVPPQLERKLSLDRRPSIEAPGSMITSPVAEWGVPHQSKLKYTQLFNTSDRTRTGFLSAAQARNILIQTRLPQPILAQVWALSDTDADGRLSCEEFVLALHLCDVAKEGKPLPTTLPVDLVPPTMRRKRGSSFSLPDDMIDPAASLISSVSGVGSTIGSPDDLTSPVTFEDKRKENFDKGQAELDRRRATLLQQQMKEKEERERKEREEEARREQLRQEQEARRQAELQEQLRKQYELEQLQEEQRRKAQEHRESARKEAERQRQQEWEQARTSELETQRQREQDTVLKLKAKNQSLAIELSTLTGRVKELSSKISETRSGVSAVKTTIDGMRSTRDTHMSEMSLLKAKLKEQNQRLLLMTQEKAKLEAKGKISAAVDAAVTEQTRVAFTNKQITIKHLTDKLEELQKEVQAKTDDLENNNQQLKDLRDHLKNLINTCESIYETYSEKRDAVLQLKAASSGGWGSSAPSAWEAPVADSWGSAPTDAWGADPAQVLEEPSTIASSVPMLDETHRRYRALYEFSSRNPDELSFMPGDIILVPAVQNAEPGWFAGELRGATGWFPESYVEPVDSVSSASVPLETSQPEKQPLEGILEVPEGGDIKPADGISESYVSVYPYQSAEIGDLSFQQGEAIIVIKKEGDWWTGVIGNRTGIFPSNYVAKDDASLAASHVTDTPTLASSPAPDDTAAQDSDDVFLQSIETKTESKSPAPTTGSACVSGRETPSEFDRTKPATPDFSQITAAQTKIGKKGEIATVIAPYQASSSEQLSLARGQLVCIRKKTTTGWWEGELQAKGKKKQVGWFPASYVKVMASRRLSQTTPDFEAEMNAQKVIALFPYKALNEDELTFEKDDVINVISRDDAAWWKGELRGVTGLFPSNYVMPVDNQLMVLNSEEKQRQDAITELVESERAYTNDMSIVRMVFEKPLYKSGLLTREQMGRIFLNWREILRGSLHLLKLLDERRQQSPTGLYDFIGDILRDNLPRMSAYIRFCSCQLSAGTLLQELTDSSHAFRELCRQCQRDPKTQGLPLSTFLIKPMQRITKYPLLISKILQHTPINHQDRSFLEEAQIRADELCSQVNEGVRQRENAEWLEWLQSHIILDGLEEHLVFNSLTKYLGPRKFLHHGILTKTRSGRELVGFLLNDILVLAQPLKALPNGFRTLDKHSNLIFKLYKKPLMVHDVLLLKASDTNDRSLVFSFSNIQCAVTASSAAEANQWLRHFKAAKERPNADSKLSYLGAEGSKEPAIGRLLVEVVEAVNIEGRCLVCEMQLGPEIKSTPPALPPYKWNCSMQFLVRNIAKDTILLCLKINNELAPDEIIDRSEIKLSEIKENTRSTGHVLRKLSLKHQGNAEVHIKFDLVLFH